MWPIILSFVLLGAVLLIVEVFIPGMIVGLLGMASLIAATVICYAAYGADAGNLLLGAELVGGVFFTAWWLKYVPRTSFARKWTLNASVAGESQSVLPPTLLEQVGTAVTQLRPAGIALINGQRMDVVSDGTLIESGTPIRVHKIEGNRVVVRPTE